MMADGARRRQRKGVVTRHLGTLERLVAEEDIDGVRSRLDRVKHSFDEFEDTHNNYRDSLENEEEIEVSDAWFQDMQTTYVAGVKGGFILLTQSSAAYAAPLCAGSRH